ncbi:FAD FMN dehydrogenase [Rhodovulum sp. PH10]|uniref:DUF2163 domain-containing protein n=1 Tax=Rhodovulum sp. PH10 TaxID=1187851 RepID=UPI00027C26E0|nr:DUF2163 domain-containing protein [Rhodovulum sp. PH10]EJW10160.1 FAD FMN dehydrogenase [Rhodovulum sp. PH10]
MRTLPAALQAKLETGVTTLCRCWLIRRRDGVVLGFTDHDEDVSLGGIVCLAGTGLDASEATARLGLQIDGGEVSGALASDSLAETDLAAGRYDAATVETHLVDWSEPALSVLLFAGTLGEVRREGLAFTAELRGIADRLAQTSGRLYTADCTASLGDAKCRVDLSSAAHRADGTVTSLLGTSMMRVSGCEAFADGAFTAGRLTFASGANAGVESEVKRHAIDPQGVVITLWQAMPEPIAPGDGFVITSGCDKRFVTCRDRFANTANFRGFPHIPGNDFVIRYPS